MLVAVSDTGVTAILMGDDRPALARELMRTFPNARLAADEAALQDTSARVVALLEAPHEGLNLPLDIRGGPLEQVI